MKGHPHAKVISNLPVRPSTAAVDSTVGCEHKGVKLETDSGHSQMINSPETGRIQIDGLKPSTEMQPFWNEDQLCIQMI